MSAILTRDEFLKLTGVEPYQLTRWSNYGILPQPLPRVYRRDNAIAAIVTKELRARNFWISSIRRLVRTAVAAYSARGATPYLVVTSKASGQAKNPTARAHAIPAGQLFEFLEKQNTGAMLVNLPAIALQVDTFYATHGMPV